MRISPKLTESVTTVVTKLTVARMVSGLRWALCRKEIQSNPDDPRLRLFQSEDAARRANWIFREEEGRIRLGKSNRAQIRGALGGRISAELKKQGLSKLEKPNTTALELLGCDAPHFFLHIERQFREGMGWHNYGKWVIDHILPCSSFDFRIENHLRACFHFSNMQPLWARENMSKGSRNYEAFAAY